MKVYSKKKKVFLAGVFFVSLPFWSFGWVMYVIGDRLRKGAERHEIKRVESSQTM